MKANAPLNEKRSYRWIVFLTIVIGTFMVNVDSSIVNVALPILQLRYHVSLNLLQWVVTGYLLVITAILPMIGSMSDKLDRKKMFIAGISLFTLASILCALSPGFNELVIFRMLQAFGGALIQANVMSIVAFTFPKGQRGKPLGLISSVVAIGTIVGPAVGGIVLALMGWRYIFWVNVPFGIISIVLSIFVLKPISRGIGMKEFDWWGSVWFLVATITLLLYISSGDSLGFTSITGILLLIVSLISWIAFIRRQSHVKGPLIDLSLFLSPRFSISNIAGYISYIIMIFPSMILPLYIEQLLHIPVSQMGLLLMVQSIVMVLIAPLGGWLSDHKGAFLPTVSGMVLMTIAMLDMFSLGRNNGMITIIVAQTLLGAGLGLFTSPNNVVVIESVPIQKSGLTGSLIATIRNFGRVTGVAFAMLLLQAAVGTQIHYPATQFINGIHLVFGTGILLGLAGTILVSIRKSGLLHA